MKKIILIIVLAIVLILYIVPTKIEKDIKLVKVKYGDFEVASEVKIHFDGYKYNKIFQESIFEGNIELGGTLIEGTQIYLDDIGPLIGSINSSEDCSTFGSIYVTNSFDEVTILINEDGHWSMSEGVILTGPANSREEAVVMINRHFTSSRWPNRFE